MRISDLDDHGDRCRHGAICLHGAETHSPVKPRAIESARIIFRSSLSAYCVSLPGLFAPVPGVDEGRDLRVRGVPLRAFAQDIVAAFGVESRIEVDQLRRFAADEIAQYVEVVSKENWFIIGRLGSVVLL